MKGRREREEELEVSLRSPRKELSNDRKKTELSYRARGPKKKKKRMKGQNEE